MAQLQLRVVVEVGRCIVLYAQLKRPLKVGGAKGAKAAVFELRKVAAVGVRKLVGPRRRRHAVGQRRAAETGVEAGGRADAAHDLHRAPQKAVEQGKRGQALVFGRERHGGLERKVGLEAEAEPQRDQPPAFGGVALGVGLDGEARRMRERKRSLLRVRAAWSNRAELRRVEEEGKSFAGLGHGRRRRRAGRRRRRRRRCKRRRRRVGRRHFGRGRRRCWRWARRRRLGGGGVGGGGGGCRGGGAAAEGSVAGGSAAAASAAAMWAAAAARTVA